jgi:hypothetical protein
MDRKYCRAKYGNVWDNWEDKSRCGTRASCVPINSTTGFCSCEYYYELANDSANGCVPSTSGMVSTGFWLTLAVMSMFVAARAIRIALGARKQNLLRLDTLSIAICGATLTALSDAVVGGMWSYVKLSTTDDDFVRAILLTKGAIALCLFGTLSALVNFGSFMLLALYRGRVAERSSQSDSRRVYAVSGVIAVITFIAAAGLFAIRLDGLAVFGYVIGLLLCWSVFRLAHIYTIHSRKIVQSGVLHDVLAIFQPATRRIAQGPCFHFSCARPACVHLGSIVGSESTKHAIRMWASCLLGVDCRQLCLL